MPGNGTAVIEMRSMLFVVAFLVGFFTSVQSADTSCPLSLADIVKPPLECFTPKLDNFTGSQCCYSTYANLADALAIHTNSSASGQLFLEEPEEQDCANEFVRLNLTTDYCGIAPPVFTANEGPCLFATESQLSANLSQTAVPLTNLSASCADVQQQAGCVSCRDMYNKAKDILVNQTGDTSANTNCGTALLIFLASRNISNSDWKISLYSCLDIPFTPVLAAQFSNSKGKTNDIITVLATLLGVVSFSVFVGAILFFRKRCGYETDGSNGSEDDKTTEHGDGPANKGSLYEFSAKELSKASDSFTEKNFIGEGSAGKVYRGILPSGQQIAIKLILNKTKLDIFYKEIENLSKVRHPNLVTLLGYCQTPDKSFLVYEYCSRGNLWFYLFGGGDSFTWEQRLNIALGSARALMCLHMNPGGYIVHRDVKPTNILLTEAYEAKVTDFGLSRLVEFEESTIFTEVKGTTGYLDPEYLNHGTLTFSSDVYSFGIVLLQLVSGRRPIDLDTINKVPLVKMANLVMRREAEISDFVDPRLQGAYSQLSCRRVIELAVQCTSGQGVYRPSMIEVRQRLEEAWALGGLPTPFQSTSKKKSRTKEGTPETEWKGSISPPTDEHSSDHSR